MNKSRRRSGRILLSYIGIFSVSLFCVGSIAAWFAMGTDVTADGMGVNIIDISEEKSISMGINSGTGTTIESMAFLPGDIKRIAITISNSDSNPKTGKFSITGIGDAANPNKKANLKDYFQNSDPLNSPTDASITGTALTAYKDRVWNEFCMGGPYIDINTNKRYALSGSQTYESLFLSCVGVADSRDAIKLSVAEYDSTWNDGAGGYKIYDYVQDTYVSFNQAASTYSTDLFSMTLNDFALAEAGETNPEYTYTVAGKVGEEDSTTNIYILIYFDPYIYPSCTIGSNTVELRNSNAYYYQSTALVFNTIADSE